MAKYPDKLNMYNLPYFFDIRNVSPNQILPGNIIQFVYKSPDGVHDKKPLVYVLNTEGDRVWGVNLHYRFNLLGDMVDDKKQLILNTKQSNQKQNISTEPSQKQLGSSNIPSYPEFKENRDSQKEIKPANNQIDKRLLEVYNLNNPPKDILRNYLYTRISSLTKLTFKVLEQ